MTTLTHSGMELIPMKSSTKLMQLTNINHDMDWIDFDEVVKFLQNNLDCIIHEVHDELHMDQLYDGKNKLVCPSLSSSSSRSLSSSVTTATTESSTSHDAGTSEGEEKEKEEGHRGNLILHTISTKEPAYGITPKREFKVYDIGVVEDHFEPTSDEHWITIREEIINAPINYGPPIYWNNTETIRICRNSNYQQ